jgi:hypothetical protein
MRASSHQLSTNEVAPRDLQSETKDGAEGTTGKEAKGPAAAEKIVTKTKRNTEE